jgi:mannose-6-phosphate isomerase-like protein (cupin superfamily)
VCEGFTLEYVDVGDVTLRVRHGGDGQPAVLLHGHPRTHTTWHRIAPQLAGSFFVARPDLRANDLRNNGEVSVQNYDIRYDDKYGQLAQIDIAAEGEGYEPWVNQTLTCVNDCVVRLAVIEGELVDWHSHEHKEEFFLVLEGRLELEVEGRDPFLLGVHQGVTIPRGVVHRPRAHGRTVLLTVEPATVIPTGND